MRGTRKGSYAGHRKEQLEELELKSIIARLVRKKCETLKDAYNKARDMVKSLMRKGL